jgi:hypothetical protein
MRVRDTSLSAARFLSLSLLLTGCALQATAVSVPEIVPAITVAGTVHGGQQPIVNARVSAGGKSDQLCGARDCGE